MVCLRDRRRAVDAGGMVMDEEDRGGSAASARGNGKGKFSMSSGSSKMPLKAPAMGRGRVKSRRVGGDA